MFIWVLYIHDYDCQFICKTHQSKNSIISFSVSCSQNQICKQKKIGRDYSSRLWGSFSFEVVLIKRIKMYQISGVELSNSQILRRHKYIIIKFVEFPHAYKDKYITGWTMYDQVRHGKIWLNDYMVFYAVSAIFRPYNGGLHDIMGPATCKII